MSDSGKNAETAEILDSGAPQTLQTLAPEAPDFLHNLGFPVDAVPGLSFQDSFAVRSSLPIPGNSSLQQAGAIDSVEASPAATSVPAACAVNSACFDELVTTSETRSLPADGTQSASAAVNQQRPSLEQLPSGPSEESSPRAAAGEERRGLRKKRPVESPAEPVKIPPLKEVQSMLETQKKLLDSQLADLEKLLKVQFQLTGVNPLVQELKSAVLGPKAVKKPDQPLSQETLQLLREVYAVKDTVTKKEVRDLSLLTGASQPQIKDFFAGQQARVKRLLHQLSLDGGGRADVNLEQSRSHFFPANTSGISGLSTSDSVEKLVESMRLENTFTGQSNILQVILQADYVPGLRLFLDRGGLRFLSKWLNQAFVEEQTSLIRLILKALFHLPMVHAVPAQVSPLLQLLTRLRSHFAADVSGGAITLLSRWAKLFSRTGVGKILAQAAEPRKNDAGLQGAQELFKQSSSSGQSQFVSGPEKKKQKTELSTDNKPDALKPQNKAVLAQPNLKGLHMSERPSSSVNLRRTLQTVEDPALTSDATKKRLAEHGKEKRRVVLVEEISATNRRIRDGESRRASAMEKGSRPLSADEIRKAKMRERLLQGSNQKDAQQAGRPKEPAPSSSSRSTEAEPAANSSGAHFQAAHSLPGRQDAALHEFQQHESQPALRRSPPEVQRSSRPPPPPPPPDQVPGAYRLGEPLPVNRMQQQQPEPAPSLFQPAHALPSRQDPTPAPPPPVALPASFFSMVQQAPAPYHPPQASQPWPDAVKLLTDQMQQEAGAPEAENEAGKSEAESKPEPEVAKPEAVVEDRIVAEAEGEHPLDSPPQVLIGDLLKRLISWCMPSAVFVDPQWSVAHGEESKEREVQSSRVRREAEEFYSDPGAIPQNPKDPWDEEQDYDDSLTPEVPLEASEEPEPEPEKQAAPAQAQPAPSHDPELLALLLRNPALVSELTSKQVVQGGLQSFSNQHQMQQGQFGQSGVGQQRPVELYGQHQQQQQQSQYFGNAAGAGGGYNPSSDHRAQWSNGAGEVFNRQQQQHQHQHQHHQQQQQYHQNQQQYYNYKGGNAGNPTQWKQRVSNNNVSFGHGNLNNQGMEQMGLRPPPPAHQHQHHHHHHQLAPNNVLGNDRFHQPHLPPHQQQQHQQQQPWYNPSLQRHSRPGGW